MAERLTFILEGRDNLSRVLGHAGDSADRLRRQMEDASDGSGRALLHLTQDADGRLHDLEGRFVSVADAAALMATRTEATTRPMADWSRVADEARRVGQELRMSWLALTPAALPMAATLAPIAASTAAAGSGIAVLALATGRQVAAMTEAAQAEKKYNDAVEDSGRTSAAAVKAQVAYAKQMAKLPPETRRAAAALSAFKDSYTSWADSLSAETTAPLIKGMGVVQGIFPKLTPTVKGAAEQLDRLFTIAGGRVASPGFDGFMQRVDKWSTGALTRANDALVHLLRTADRPAVNGGISDFMSWAREQGPAVSAVLRDLGRALVNVLEAGGDVGVGMLTVVQALSHLVAAVPPEAITMLLQLAIAIKATAIAMAALGAARAFMTMFTAQLATMGAASTATTGRMAALTASFGAMSRGAKAALIGSGIGLLVIALSELSQMGKRAPADIDQMTGSIRNLGHTGLLTGEAARVMGQDFGELEKSLRTLARPSNLDATQQWLTQLIGMDSTPVSEAKDTLDALDQSLANLVRSGNAQAAADALKVAAANIGNLTADELREQMDGYRQALDDVAFEQEMAAAAMGLFGHQALATKQKLDAQKMSADGLRQAIQALNDVNRAGISAQIGFEQALDASAKAAQENAGVFRANGGTLDLNTEKGRTAATALNDLAAKTDAAATAARESGASWSTVNGIYDRGRQQLLANARQMGLNETAARNLANQILKTPDKTAKLRGNLEDLQAKLADAKRRLASVPDSKKAAIRAEISQLQAQIARAKGAIASVQGKTVSVMVDYRTRNSGATPFTKAIGGYAGGGTPRPGETFWVGEDGPELMTLGRGGSARVWDHETSMNMVRQAGAGRDVGAGLMAGMSQARAGVEQAARGMAAGVEAGVKAELQIASPSKKMVALMQDVRNGVVSGLTASKSKIKATAMDLVKDIWTAWEGTKSTRDTALVRMVNREHAKLQTLAGKRDALRTRLGSAQALLKARIDERARYATDVRSQARSASGLSSLNLEPARVSAGSIKQGLGQKLSRLRQFSRWISILTKRGTNKSLLREVIAMGPEEGYAYASALVGMSNTDLRAVNSLQSQIDKESDTLGKRAASTMYDAGVNSARGLVKGLQSQEKAIIQQMYRLAKAMENAIRAALKIKSPSQVAHGLGLNFGQGLGGGALASMPLVGRAADALAGRMSGIRPMPGRVSAGLGIAAAAGGGTQFNITVQGAIDPVGTAKQIEKVLLKLNRTNGG
ncbi:hypothetical protein [Streptomyces lateritius]|uniref:hypothetical protein n=1 Tax=Streptomyces lateritius TaxID=67313 RepID=UPI001C8B468B|nr:hypothetical protein [Streptomyces lateritius]MBX9425424.1 hypothetical protein [Streptomyces lateritius]